MISYDDLYELIPNDRFITKAELIQLTGLSDRTLRDMVSHIKMSKTIISNCDKRGYKRGKGTELLKTIDDIEYELGIVKKSIKEINSRKKVYNKQLRQYIAYMKVLEKRLEELKNGKEIVTIDSISLEIAKLFRLERKIVELSASIKADLAAKEKLKKQLFEKKKKIYEMRKSLIERGILKEDEKIDKEGGKKC